MFAFSDWFDDRLFGTGKLPYMQEPRPTWGFWTFMAIGKRLEPSKHVPEGYYAEYFAEPGVLQSNIYTMYRGLIYDFTIPGALAFMAFLGTLSAYAYRRMLQSAHAPFSQAFYIALAGFTYSSYLLSLGTWLSVYVAGGCVALVLMVMPWITQRVIRRRIANEQ
jgi:oligosaccharide repeat unit polymerase